MKIDYISKIEKYIELAKVFPSLYKKKDKALQEIDEI